MSKIRELECCCCGRETIGRQWWNRDTGYGLCERCADIISNKEDEETMQSCYGTKGKHYCLDEKDPQDALWVNKEDKYEDNQLKTIV